ncbi:MAG: chemotaxis protein CheA [Nitrospiraceae bacterium]|nr:chemotaxis protein CheA [Nitrospiraceae bacterium]
MPDDMEEIITDFLVEAEETIDRVDPLLVGLEDSGFDQETINEIFRGMHTIKGAAGFLGFQQIVDVSHRAESILKKLRDKEIAPARPLLDVILRSFDTVRLLLKQIKAKGHEGQAGPDTARILQELDAALQAAGPLGDAGRRKGPEEVRVRAVVIEGAGGPAPESAAGCGSDRDGHASKASAPMPDKGAEAASADKKNDTIQTLRIGVEKVDHVMNLTGEVVLIRNRLLNLAGGLEQKYSSDPQMESLVEAISFLDLLTSDMQSAVMKMRMQPLKKVFGKFPRLVKDISFSLGKQVDLRISGEQTEVDKSVIENIADPMVHIIRNAIDHAIGPPDERLAGGKPAKGTISITASQKGNHIVIEVGDDGKGIDVEKVKSKAVSKGLITEAEALDLGHEAAVNLIFLPGLSTNEVATELSGRGVGMDVVKSNVSKLNGFIEVITKKGAGTMFRISLPLTLAIIHALLVEVEGSVYAIPLTLVDETMKVEGAGIRDLMDKKVLNIRGRVYPYFELAWLLEGRTGQRGGFNGQNGQDGRDHRYIIVVAVADSRFCIGVDGLLGLQEVVIKSITGSGSAAPSILGATISGDGKVILILDLGYIARNLFDKEHVNT